MSQHESNVVTAMHYQVDDTKARELRQLAVEVSNAVEARIMGQANAGERIRRSTQNVQIAGMGPAEYWGTQLWQASPSPLVTSNYLSYYSWSVSNDLYGLS